MEDGLQKGERVVCGAGTEGEVQVALGGELEQL
jgi:preprotein translocase subunit YajC